MHRVLIAVDDEASAQGIIGFVFNSCWPDSTVFRVLHAIEPADAVANWPSEEYRRRAGEVVSAVAKRLGERFKTLEVEELVVEGAAKESLIDQAQSWKADAIIVGTHGRRGVSRFLLGSVSEAVVEHAPCTVIVARG